MQSDQLIQLILSLTKAEKKAFRLHVNKDQHGDQKMYVMLFDQIESSKKNYSDTILLKKNPSIKKSQIPNLKAHLLQELLRVVRQLHRDNHTDIKIREYIDYSRILQDKGLIRLSLDILDKASKMARELDDTMLIYLVNAEVRRVESLYITGSSTQKAMQLNEDSKALMFKIDLLDRLSNLSLMLYGMYLKYGYIKNKRDHEYIKDFFNSHLPDLNVDQLGFFEKVYYYQSHVWYNHMTLDFAQYYRYSLRWTECFLDHPNMMREDVVLYLKSLHNTLNALYMSNKSERFVNHFSQYLTYGDDHFKQMNKNEQSHYELFRYIHLLNGIFLSADYKAGSKYIAPLVKLLDDNPYSWDVNRIMIFYYKIACVYFGNDDYNQALLYLNKIIASPMANLRVDIQCFARILTLISHYELGNEYLLPYQIKSVYRYLYKMDQVQFVIKEILNFIRRIPQMDRRSVHKEFVNLRENLVEVQNDKYQKQPFLYLDIIAWLDSKIHNTPIAKVIKAKIKNEA